MSKRPSSTTPDSPSHSLMVTVTGTPRAQPRPRFFGRAVVSTADRPARLWKDAVERAARAAVAANGGAGVSGACTVDLVFRFFTADSYRIGEAHTAKPDADNLAKLALDAFVTGGLLAGDDAKAATLSVRKVWGMTGGMSATVRPGTPQDVAGDVCAVAAGWLRGGQRKAPGGVPGAL